MQVFRPLIKLFLISRSINQQVFAKSINKFGVLCQKFKLVSWFSFSWLRNSCFPCVCVILWVENLNIYSSKGILEKIDSLFVCTEILFLGEWEKFCTRAIMNAKIFRGNGKWWTKIECKIAFYFCKKKIYGSKTIFNQIVVIYYSMIKSEYKLFMSSLSLRMCKDETCPIFLGEHIPEPQVNVIAI
jgi:hypothetical protein